ncbi:MAG: adenylate/guanylate cyclase domain-containing protein [Desulfobulbus sp.]|nr:adenylate/guanylate cyclase domain-containing protein [Desulfobulbus sp.]
MSATEHKMILMLTDVSGSANLFKHLDNGEAMRAVDRCLKRIKRSIDGYRGKVVQLVGDEVLATYETAEEACQAAIDMQQRIADLPPVSGLKLTIRIGLHAGLATEEGGKLSGDAVTSAARIAGIAHRDQILCSSALVAELPEGSLIKARLMPVPGVIDSFMAASVVGTGLLSKADAAPDLGENPTLFSIHWTTHETGGYSPSVFGPVSPVAERLRVRYRGKTFLIDDREPVLTLGRDLGNTVVVEDRKASRQHARIERRQDGYFLVDTSTNGCFVSINSRRETRVRRQECLLEGKGLICFGSSHSEPDSDGAEFEHL